MTNPEFDKAADAAADQLRAQMEQAADKFVIAAFEQINTYVDEDLGPVLAMAGIPAEATRWAFLRMVLTRLFKYGHSAHWGPTEKQQAKASAFAQEVLGHLAKALTDNVGELARIAVIWGEDEDEEKGPTIIRPGGST